MNPKPRSRDARVVNRWINGGITLYKILGDYALGLALVKCYCEGHEGQTIDSIAAILGDILSNDTVRRRMTKMVEAGMVDCTNYGRFRVYKIKAEVAEKALAYIRQNECL